MVITGRFSLRDDKEPQILVNRARPMSDFANSTPAEEVREEKERTGTLYLRLDNEDNPAFRKVKAILNMFPGSSNVVLYFVDKKQRRGTRCVLMDNMLRELQNVLGEGNVVIK